jgi:Xaa-Pro aminopeptidase
LAPGALLLVDSGCEKQLYTADVTRTFPVGGRFTPEQRALYEVVLASQRAGLELCQPGGTLPAIHKRVCEVLTAGLVELGLLKGSPAELQEKGAFRRYYMHGTSHWLGLDVHDAGRYDTAGEARPLQPGMVFTVEPGRYVAEDDATAPAAFRGLGVRIEDDVLITEGGHRVLTSEVPTAVAEVEALTARA